MDFDQFFAIFWQYSTFFTDEETIQQPKPHDDDSDDIASTKGKCTTVVVMLDDCRSLSLSLDSFSINGIFHQIHFYLV